MEGLNTAYAVQSDEQGVSYPSIQATEYRPRTLKDQVKLCLSEDSFNMLSEDYYASLGSQASTAFYGDDEVPIFVLPDEVRFVALGVPRMFAQDKDTKEVSYLQRGVKLSENNQVTITRLSLLMVLPDGKFVMDGDRPQIFTLKLTSNKTKLVGGDRKDPEFKSLQSLQQGLQKFYKLRGQSLTHLVSVKLVAKPEQFTSAKGDSKGIMFALEGGAKALPEEMQRMTFDLLQDEDIKALIDDPFGLKRTAEAKPSSGEAAPSESDDVSDDVYDDIPF